MEFKDTYDLSPPWPKEGDNNNSNVHSCFPPNWQTAAPYSSMGRGGQPYQHPLTAGSTGGMPLQMPVCGPNQLPIVSRPQDYVQARYWSNQPQFSQSKVIGTASQYTDANFHLRAALESGTFNDTPQNIQNSTGYNNSPMVPIYARPVDQRNGGLHATNAYISNHAPLSPKPMQSSMNSIAFLNKMVKADNRTGQPSSDIDCLNKIVDKLGSESNHSIPPTESSAFPGVTPPSMTLATPQSAPAVTQASGTPPVMRPKSGRAKTNAELKKQLMERREQQRLRTQLDGGSPTSVDVVPSSPSPNTLPGSPRFTLPSPATSPVSVDMKLPFAAQSPGIEADDMAAQSANWNIGDMLWSKVSGHPWWPCMIAPDPTQNAFTKLVPRRPNCVLRHYHVLFFGDEGERGWVVESSSIPYAGRTAFERHCQTMMSRANIKDRKNFVIAPNRRRAWDIAVSSAEHAWMLSREQRLEEFMPSPSPVPSAVDHRPAPCRIFERSRSEDIASVRRTNSIRDYQSVVNTNETAAAISRHSASFSSDEDRSKSTAVLLSPTHGSRSDVQNFAAFCRHRRKSFCVTHPEFTAEQIDKLLQMQWNQMDETSKAKFASMCSDVSLPNCNPTNGSTKVEHTNTPVKPVARRRNSSPASSTPKRRGRPTKVARVGSMSSSSPVATEPSVSTVQVAPPGGFRPVAAGPEIPDFSVEVCRTCEHPCTEKTQSLHCAGRCLAIYHTSCLPAATNLTRFMCDACRTGNHSCFMCGGAGTTTPTVHCGVPQCGRFYHANCMDGKRCRLHTCASCLAERKRTTTDRMNADSDDDDADDADELYQCVRCPTAYHTTYKCLAAGSQLLGGRAIVCSRHVVPAKVHSHISASWCLSCDKGGLLPLVHCCVCPASYHAVCLPRKISLPATQWKCPDCARGHRPLYGDVVWVKYSNYRWWPGQICYPEIVPLNIRDLPHDVGQFAVYFFGTRDYLWTHHGRVLPYTGNDKGCLEQPTTAKSLARVFQKALREAREAFSVWQNDRDEPAANESFARNMPTDKNQLQSGRGQCRRLSHEQDSRSIGDTDTVTRSKSDSVSSDDSQDSVSTQPCDENFTLTTELGSNCDRVDDRSALRPPRVIMDNVESELCNSVTCPASPVGQKSESKLTTTTVDEDIEMSSTDCEPIELSADHNHDDEELDSEKSNHDSETRLPPSNVGSAIGSTVDNAEEESVISASPSMDAR